jgi:hypothetical protein
MSNAIAKLEEARDRIDEMEGSFSYHPDYRIAVEGALRILDAAISEERNEAGNGDGLELIRCERERHKSREGWTPEHDDKHTGQEMALAAICYAIPRPALGEGIEYPWPSTWDEGWFKPSKDNRIRDLEKAGALIAAEIDRLMRAAEVKLRLEKAKGE